VGGAARGSTGSCKNEGPVGDTIVDFVSATSGEKGLRARLPTIGGFKKKVRDRNEKGGVKGPEKAT